MHGLKDCWFNPHVELHFVLTHTQGFKARLKAEFASEWKDMARFGACR